MPRLPLTDLSTDAFYAVLGNRPELYAAWSALDDALLFDPSSVLPTALKEEVRSSLAQGVGCRYCATVGGPPQGAEVDPRAGLAAAFAEQVVANKGTIDDSMFEVLREEFDTAEITELCAWICFKFGANVMGALMKLEPATAEQAETYRALLTSSSRT